MRKVLRFIFNLARNLSFALVLLITLFTLAVSFFPKSTEAFAEELLGTDLPSINSGGAAYAGRNVPVEGEEMEVLSSPTTDFATTFDGSEAVKLISVGNSSTRITFPADEFVSASSSGRAQYVNILLENGVSGEVRGSYVAIEAKLVQGGVKVFKSKNGVVNLAKVRIMRSDPDSFSDDRPLLLETRGQCGGTELAVPANRKGEFRDAMRKFYGIED